RKGSLLGVIDRTITGAGARLLHRRLSSPLAVRKTIEARLDEVESFASFDALRQDLRDLLKATPDLERALSRLSLGRAGPRDLSAMGAALKMTAAIRARFDAETPPPATLRHLGDLGSHGELVELLQSALDAELPVLARDGGFVRAGFRTDLDELKTLRDESRRLIASLQRRYQDETQITALKIKHNNVLGYFIEVPARHGEKLLGQTDGPFIHRQTIAGAVRFSTVELGELAGKIARAGEQATALELEIFEQLCTRTLEDMDAIALAARALARLDVASSLAQLAIENNYVRPEISDGLEFEIEGGRHPVVEAALMAGEGERFVANDCHLDETHGKLWLLTGP
ncbi:MAG: DNA mismatch repair protein MutS, partial [Rhodospirillaceae bacterium]|nr:DNA mismatch repair protein MutS [Rhodospirillaceae bacterium]